MSAEAPIYPKEWDEIEIPKSAQTEEQQEEPMESAEEIPCDVPKEQQIELAEEPQINCISSSVEILEYPTKLELPQNLKSDLNDAWNAQCFLTVAGPDVRYGRETIKAQGVQGWYVWNGHKWDPNAGHEVVRDFLRIAPLLEESAAEVLLPIEDPKVRSATETLIYRHFKSLQSAKGIRDALFLAAQNPSVNCSVCDFDANPNLLNLQNGTLDFSKKELREHRRADLITKYIDIPYNPDAECPRWEQFIEEIMCGDMELVDYLQRAAGYSMTGCTDEELMFVLYGGGANGKSVFLRVIHDILGDYARQGSQDMLTSMSTPDGDRANVSIASLRGAYFVSMSETRQNARLQENLVKQLTGNDPITARRMYENFSTFIPRFKIWLATNHKPVVGDTGLGMWRRLKLVPFAATFTPEQQDDKLYDKLMAEREGILAWLVRGELMRQERSLKRFEAEAVTESTAEYRTEMDKIQLFLDECTEPALSTIDCVSIERLYEMYVDWCKDAGEKPMSKRFLGLRLKDKGYTSGRRGHERQRFWNCLAEKKDG